MWLELSPQETSEFRICPSLFTVSPPRGTGPKSLVSLPPYAISAYLPYSLECRKSLFAGLPVCFQ